MRRIKERYKFPKDHSGWHGQKSSTLHFKHTPGPAASPWDKPGGVPLPQAHTPYLPQQGECSALARPLQFLRAALAEKTAWKCHVMNPGSTGAQPRDFRFFYSLVSSSHRETCSCWGKSSTDRLTSSAEKALSKPRVHSAAPQMCARAPTRFRATFQRSGVFAKKRRTFQPMCNHSRN